MNKLKNWINWFNDSGVRTFAGLLIVGTGKVVSLKNPAVGGIIVEFGKALATVGAAGKIEKWAQDRPIMQINTSTPKSKQKGND